MSTTLIADHAEQLVRRILQESIKELTVTHWLRRAAELEAVGTPWADGAALECRRHAWLLAQLPRLDTIGFNGGTAHRLGMRQLGPLAARYRVLALPSSSPAHTMPYDAKLRAWRELAGPSTDL